MPLSDFVTVTITSDTRTPTKQGFGTPLVLGYFTAWPDRVRTYNNLTEMDADGIESTGVGAATYWAAAAIFAQNPRVKKVKVGRRTNIWTQVIDLAPSAVEGDVTTVTITPLGGSAVPFVRTVPASSTVAAEITALKTLIDAESISGLTTASAVGNTVLRCTATPGMMFVYSGRNPETTLFDSTAAPAGIDTDMAAVYAADPDWYGMVLDSSSKAEVLIAAAKAETMMIDFFATTGDTENGTVGASSTLLKQLKALGYIRTSTWFNSAAVPSFLGAGIMGEEFPYDPGTETGTYNGKSLAGVVVDNPSTTAEGEVVAQNGNVYTSILGLSVTRPGKNAAGEFIDITIGRDWLVARLKEALFGALTGARRVPYTDGGVATLEGVTRGVLMRAQGSKVKPGFLDPEHEISVTAPLVADVDPADRAARIFPDLSFAAKISGAIHAVDLQGVISV